MKYLLDTNICIYIIKQKPIKVLNKFKKYQISNICISSITLSEFEYGIEKSTNPNQNRIALNEFLTPIGILSFDNKAAMFYGQIRAELEKIGKIAMFGMHPVARVVASFVMGVTNKEDMRFFKSKEDALLWLKE